MRQWKHTAVRLFNMIEEPLDNVRLQIKLRRGWLDPLTIQAYRGHGTTTQFYVKGRVLDQSGLSELDASDNAWENIVNMYRRFSSDEIAGARVRARIGEQSWDATTDGEGYFTLQLGLDQPADVQRMWHNVALELLEPTLTDQPPVRTVGHVLVPPPSAQCGIISDIDDTVVKTDATNLLRMARIVLLSNAHTRLPFEGVAAFYRALRRGATGRDHNPIFYVSSGPWNLYDLLIDFLNIHGIPVGPLFLRDFGLNDELLGADGHHSHKLTQIERVLATYPQLPFVLIGDSGQEDPEIYQQVVQDFPGRIRVIYIRDVASQQRHAEVQQIVNALQTQGVPMLLVRDTVAAAEHAAAHDLIRPDALPTIRAKKAEDAHG